MNNLLRKNYPELGEVKAPYVHSVKHGNTLYISGLTAFGTAAQQ
ncbi:MAG: RidA family protein, partial [Enterobacteriaceae bacterium]